MLNATPTFAPDTNVIKMKSLAVSFALLTSAVLVLAATATAQQRPSRAFHTGTDRRPLGAVADSEWSVGIGGQLIWCSSTRPESALVTCGVTAPGGLFVLSGTEVLVAGRSVAGDGIIEHWKYASGALTLSSATTHPGKDFAGVVYAPSSGLYALDCIGNQVLRGAWDGSASLGTISLSAWARQSAVPSLTYSSSLVLVPSGSVTGGDMLLVEWPIVEGSAYASLTYSASGPVVSIGGEGSPYVLASGGFFLNGLTVTEGASAVEVWGIAGSQVDVTDLETAEVVGSGVIGASGTLVVGLTSTLELGHRYIAGPTGQSLPVEHAVMCVCRHGFPETFSDGTQIRGMYYQMGAEIGRTFFVEVGLHDDTPSSAGAVLDGMMLIGFRIGGVDPLIMYGSNTLLATGVYVPAIGFVSGGNGWGLAYSAITIPDDPGLIGLVFLAQFVMRDGPDYRLSQVYGAQIEGSAAMMSASVPSAAALHIQDALTTGRLRDATLPLLDVLLRR